MPCDLILDRLRARLLRFQLFTKRETDRGKDYMGLAMDPSRRHRGFLIGIILCLLILMRVESAPFDAFSSNARGMASTGLNNALNSVGGLYSYTSGLQGNMRSSGRGDQSALTACLQTLQHSQDQLKTSQSQLASIDPNKYQQQIADALTWASAALTYHTTCMDGFSLVAGQTKNNVMNRAFGVTMALNNAVSLVAALNTVAGNPTDTHNRRLQSVSEPERPVFEVEGDFPKWMPASDRRLLQTTTTLTIANAVVAKDGSGNYKTVQAAIDAAPKQSSKRWVIRVKAGTYYENVIVPKDSTYIMLMGDGMGKTIISASLSVAGSNVTTYLTATVGKLLISSSNFDDISLRTYLWHEALSCECHSVHIVLLRVRHCLTAHDVLGLDQQTSLCVIIIQLQSCSAPARRDIIQHCVESLLCSNMRLWRWINSEKVLQPLQKNVRSPLSLGLGFVLFFSFQGAVAL